MLVPVADIDAGKDQVGYLGIGFEKLKLEAHHLPDLAPRATQARKLHVKLTVGPVHDQADDSHIKIVFVLEIFVDGGRGNLGFACYGAPSF